MAVNQKVIQLKAQGKKIISLVVGEPDFDAPKPIKDAVTTALTRTFKIFRNRGVKAFREAVCMKLKRDNGLDYDPSQIIGRGAKQAISTALDVLLDAGQEVLILLLIG